MTRFNIKSAVLIGLASLLCSASGALQADEYGWCDQFSGRDACGPYLGAELLVWTACQTNLDFDFERTTNKDCVTLSEVKFADYDWTCGYRIYGGYRMGCDDWDAMAIFAHWDNSASGDAEFDTGEVAKSFAHNELTYNTLDILLGRDYQLSCSSVFQPFLGFRALWLNQDFRLKFLTTGEKFPVQTMDSDLYAAGIHMGTGYRWEVCGGAYVYGIAAATISESHVDNKHTNFNFGGSGKAEEITKEKFCMPLAGYNLAAGVSYQTCLEACGCNSWAEFLIGFEFNHWYNIPDHRRDLNMDGFHSNEILTGPDTSTKGVLNLYGLHIGATLFF